MELQLSDIFPLTAADLENPPPASVPVLPGLKRIRAVHHQAARLLATGMKQSLVALHTGVSESRLSVLKSDPSFQELMAHYAEVDEEVFVDVRKTVAALGTSAAEALHERVLENPDDISTKDLTALLSAALDRGGFAPIQKTVAATLTLPPDEVAELKRQLGVAPRRERIIDAEVLPPEEQTLVPQDSQPGMGSAVPEASLSAEAAPGSPRSGTGI